ncbi:MAG: ADP-ribosylglycohydrolase family protein [Nitriliruptoraceae bacterium]
MRAPAVLLGLALGDALGAPFEGRRRVPPGQIDRWCRAPAPLRWTDDTHMALVLARRLLADPTLADPDALGDAFAAAYADEPWRGYGAGPPQVYAMAARGQGYEQAAASLFGGSGSFGNGAAMRVAPVALVPPPGDDTEVARLARVQARLTHTHTEAVAGAQVVARIVARLLGLETPDTEVVRHTVAEVAETADAGVLRDRLREALADLDAHGDTARTAARAGTGISAAESVPAAVVALLAGRDLLGTITTAIGFGGDTDTIAAMAGAMAGAAWGLGGVPPAMLARLEAHEELTDLALRLRAG